MVSKYTFDLFSDPSVSFADKVQLLKLVHEFPNMTDAMLKQSSARGRRETKADEAGFYGNVWIRKLYWRKAGDLHDGHTHEHNHISLLARGSVLCEVEGYEAKEFHAPTFITIDKNKHHKFTALEDETVSFCIFAFKDVTGESAEDYFAEGNSPYEFKL